MTSRLHTFANGAEPAENLADAVAVALAAGIAARGKASLAVSGGSTPKTFFRTLSTRPLDWTKVIVTLVDERFVPADNPRSNHLLVAENLLRNSAADAVFLPLYQPVDDVEIAAAIASKEVAEIEPPFDVVILGMGNDGHTASFFPGGNNLERAIDPKTPRGIVAMEAQDAGEPRLTFTFASLEDARLLVLHIEGEAKKTVLSQALADGDERDMPIRAMLRRASTPVDIYWAP